MNSSINHSWDVTPAEARAIQEQLSAAVIAHDDFAPITTVAGVDVGFGQGGSITRAAVVVLRYPDLIVLHHAVAHEPTRFPYIPGLLSFREVPAILAALAQLPAPPTILLCDGNGVLHPRRCGLACHLGLHSGLPSIGVAKTLFIGDHVTVPPTRGAWQPIYEQGDVIGAAVCSRAGTRPLYVSVGHRVSLTTAIELVLACTPRYRLPETTRQAHRLASQVPAPTASSSHEEQQP